MTRRILALAAFASLLPIPALADDIGASEDVVVEQPQVQEKTVVKETVVVQEKPVSLPPPGWKPSKTEKR